MPKPKAITAARWTSGSQTNPRMGAAISRDNQAEPLYRKAIGLADQPDEESSALRVTLLSDLAGLYLKQGRPGDAEPLLLRALDGWETKPETTRLALLLNN